MLCKKLAKAKKLIANELLEKLRAVLAKKDKLAFSIKPFTDTQNFSQEKGFGETLLQEGSLGCLLVAGGQGTRAKFAQPKALVPISNVQNKTFLQLFAEKTLAASKLAGKPLKLAIMTSPLNNADIRKFMDEHDNFGLSENQIDFFEQELLPFLDDDGNPFYSYANQIAMGPNGNGHALHTFVKSGIYAKWLSQGVRYLNFVMIDNPLADPFDTALLEYHVKSQANLTLKCIRRDNSEEKVGLIVKSDDAIRVVEYSEAPKEVLADSKNYSLANISLFIINLSEVYHVSRQSLPLHAAYKPAQFYNPQNKSTKIISAWKFEYFIFDILPFIPNVQVMVFPRNQVFAPLKNADDIAKVQLALLENDRIAFRKLANTNPPNEVFELDQQFHYPTLEMKKKWQGQNAPSSPYILP